MIKGPFSTAQPVLCTVLAILGIGATCLAEQPASAPLAVASPPTILKQQSMEASSQHRFFDRKNRALFVISAALSTADFAVTRANLQSGGRELNPLVRPFANSTAGLAVNFAAQGAGTLGLSYFFHRTNHHRVERIMPILTIAGSGAAVAYSATHR